MLSTAVTRFQTISMRVSTYLTWTRRVVMVPIGVVGTQVKITCTLIVLVFLHQRNQNTNWKHSHIMPKKFKTSIPIVAEGFGCIVSNIMRSEIMLLHVDFISIYRYLVINLLKMKKYQKMHSFIWILNQYIPILNPKSFHQNILQMFIHQYSATSCSGMRC